MRVVQIGTNDGEDDLSRYLKSNYSKIEFGLFVDANSIFIDKIKESYSNYDNVNVENIAIKSPFEKENELEIFYNTADIFGQICSSKLSHVLNHSDERWNPGLADGEIKSFKVPCLTLDKLFEKYNIYYLDYLLLDIEGIESEILLNFNWKKYKIKKIEFEYKHLGDYKYNLECMLRGMGYEQVPSLHEYDCAFENKNIKEFDEMKFNQDLIEDIRTFTEFDDRDWSLPHPYGYGFRGIDDNQNEIYDAEVTDCNRYHLLEQFNKLRDNAKAILEIGIGRNSTESFCHVFFNNKKKETIYVGIDIDDRSFLRDSENNIYTIQNNSSNYSENLNIFKQIGVEKFDFIFIDGWHSINQVLLDWEYTNLLADDGIVGFHDTSCHPGPKIFLEHLDRTKWDVIENCCPKDHGIGFVKIKKK